MNFQKTYKGLDVRTFKMWIGDNPRLLIVAEPAGLLEEPYNCRMSEAKIFAQNYISVFRKAVQDGLPSSISIPEGILPGLPDISRNASAFALDIKPDADVESVGKQLQAMLEKMHEAILPRLGQPPEHYRSGEAMTQVKRSGGGVSR